MPYREYLSQADEELEAAQLLREKGFLRESVSRAYYAMYHAAQALLMLKKVFPKSHKGLIQKFGEEFIKTGVLEKEMGHMLALAETMRLKADYDIGVQIKEDECDAHLEDARQFIEKIKETAKKT